MSTHHASWRLLGIVLALAFSGCAPAYHAYPDACIPYGYCPEPPLPYVTYDNCPTPIASEFLWQHGRTSAGAVQDSVVVPADRTPENDVPRVLIGP